MSCTRCDMYLTCKNPCIPGRGYRNANLVLVGEAPGMNEDLNGIPFCGKADNLLNYILRKLGLDPEDIFITNVIRCRPVKNELPKGKELVSVFDNCWYHLEKELQDVNPKVVVLLGGTPLKLLTNHRYITKSEGMEVDTVYEGARTFAAYHPAFILRSPSKESCLARALYRAAKAAGLKPKPQGGEEWYNYD